MAEKRLEPGLTIPFDVAYGGAFYAFVDDAGIALQKEHANELIYLGRRIKQKVSEEFQIRHPFDEDLGFLYLLCFYRIKGYPAK